MAFLNGWAVRNWSDNPSVLDDRVTIWQIGRGGWVGTAHAVLLGMTAEAFLANKVHPAAAALGVVIEVMFPGRYVVAPRVNRAGRWVYGLIDQTSRKVYEGSYAQALRWLASQESVMPL